jgi:hypothetical protein
MNRFGNVLVIAVSDFRQSGVLQLATSLAEDKQAALLKSAVVHEIPNDVATTPAAVPRAEPADILFSQRPGHPGRALKSTRPEFAGPVTALGIPEWIR